jgi:hypothetical protein
MSACSVSHPIRSSTEALVLMAKVQITCVVISRREIMNCRNEKENMEYEV